ncbi:sulfurtransferase TusA family protein [Aquisalimonas asiatica]|uniref:TusA-related sulfurtransferase n=1 Tax=Aquisalimonas asiatica TaxID=406100 RepID=A0A1H8UCB7_9GAMM|nr:sulfurtransferase TusA family protein [Aquisalimonas asiatica]SEP00677.1 TusA-related sulfurtransferase [Aquisalimonas asiatica]
MAEPLVVDARGLLCPMPVIRVQDAIASATPGTEVHLLATDPGVQADVPAWCRVHGHRVEAVREEDDTLRVCIRVAE